MATAQSTKVTIVHKGGKIQFGLYKPTGKYSAKYKCHTLFLGSDLDAVLNHWLDKIDQLDNELSKIVHVTAETITVKQLCGLVLASKNEKVET